MKPKITKAGAIYDIGLIASMIGFVLVLINGQALVPLAYTALLFALLLAAMLFNIKREAHKEQQLDELQLASASFGARWSFAALGLVMLLMLFITPLQSAVAYIANIAEHSNGAPMVSPSKTFLMGLVAAMVIQLTAKSALSAIWTWTKR